MYMHRSIKIAKQTVYSSSINTTSSQKSHSSSQIKKSRAEQAQTRNSPDPAPHPALKVSSLDFSLITAAFHSLLPHQQKLFCFAAGLRTSSLSALGRLKPLTTALAASLADTELLVFHRNVNKCIKAVAFAGSIHIMIQDCILV